MHYVVNGSLVRTEYAAKPVSRPAGELVRYLSAMAPVTRSLDYGCGKCRYTGHLASRSRNISLVDSTIQLMRRQIIDGSVTRVVDFAPSRWPGCEVIPVEDFWALGANNYDFVLCANVLSAIPCLATRTRSLLSIREALAPGGRCLVVNQHTNSYFRNYANRAGTVRHMEGWVFPSPLGLAYFGILNLERTSTILASSGFKVIDGWVSGQSNYVLAGRGDA